MQDQEVEMEMEQDRDDEEEGGAGYDDYDVEFDNNHPIATVKGDHQGRIFPPQHQDADQLFLSEEEDGATPTNKIRKAIGSLY